MSDISKNKSKNVGKIISIILLVVSIILIGAGVLLTVLDISKSSDGDKKNISKEIEVNDVELRRKIENNIKVIEEFSVIGEFSSKNIFGNGVIYSNNFNSSDIDNQTKLLLILEKLYSKNVGNSPVTTDFNFGENHAYFKDIQTQINALDVETLYNSIFASNAVHMDIGTCRYFIYDDENSMYYGSSTCNDVETPYSLDTYISSITNKDNEFYAYVSVGSVDYSGGKSVVYSDYEMKNLHNGIINDPNNIVDSNNYKEFSQYKYTFVKNKDNYNFISIEKISDGLNNINYDN